jgi:hypothetical protein
VFKPLGDITRGTTNPNRLRRVDRWIAWRCGRVLSDCADPLVVDLGFGDSPITTVELHSRLTKLRPDLRVVGLEIDAARVAQAKPFEGKGLSFTRGGFELAGLRPVVVRAFNVLRQYEERAVASAWTTMTRQLAPGGHLIEGTCDELGRICAWVTIEAGSTTPATLTLAAKLSTLDSPAVFAERLPKALIHHNIPGEGIHTLLSDLDRAWHKAAPVGVFGARQRWIAAVRSLHRPTADGPARWRLGEVTFPWATLTERS